MRGRTIEMATPPENLSLASFREVPGLGADLPVVLVAKAERGGSYRRARYRRQRETIRRGEVFREMRQSLDGFIRFGTLRSLLAGDDSHRLDVEGLEPYEFVSRGPVGLFAFHDDTAIRRIDLRTGEPLGILDRVVSRGRTLGLYNVHTMDFHPTDEDRILVAVTGLDRVVEIHLPTGEATWEWCPWEHGMHTNQHGVTLVDEGSPPPRLVGDPTIERLDFETAKARVEANARPEPGVVWLHEVGLLEVPARLGLLTWQRVKLINSAYYAEGGSKVMITFWQTGEAVWVDRETGEASFVAEGLVCPHSLLPVQDGYVLTDTGGGRVLHFDASLRPDLQVLFSACPLPEGTAPDDPEWVQNTHPLTQDLLATFDFRRSRVVVWSLWRREYTSYAVDPEWVLQSIQSIHPSSRSALGLG